MKEKTVTLIILHIAVFLAGWTGIFGRLISLGGLPLVWYRMIASVVVLFAVLAFMKRIHRTAISAVMKICGCGVLLALHWVAFFASIQASNVSIGVACVATSCFFTTLFDPLVNKKRFQWKNILLSFIAIAGILDGGQRAIVRYDDDSVQGYPFFDYMQFIADIGGTFYRLTNAELLQMPAAMNPAGGQIAVSPSIKRGPEALRTSLRKPECVYRAYPSMFRPASF